LRLVQDALALAGGTDPLAALAHLLRCLGVELVGAETLVHERSQFGERIQLGVLGGYFGNGESSPQEGGVEVQDVAFGVFGKDDLVDRVGADEENVAGAGLDDSSRDVVDGAARRDEENLEEAVAVRGHVALGGFGAADADSFPAE